MVHQKDLLNLTGYIRSPIGMKKKFPVYLARSLLELDKVAVSVRKRELQIVLKPVNLIDCVHGFIKDVIREI